MESSTVSSFCRTCLAYCPISVTVENGRVVKVTGDTEAPEYEGYTCPKGRVLPEQINAPDRVLACLKRQPEGGFSTIASYPAVQEVADRLRRIIEQHGPRSVAVYIGNGTAQHPFGVVMAASLQANEFAGTSVTVNVLVPGGIVDTAMVPEGTVVKSSMLKPECMVKSLLWLLSDDGKATTGRRFRAHLWNDNLPADQNLLVAGAPIAWTSLGGQIRNVQIK